MVITIPMIITINNCDTSRKVISTCNMFMSFGELAYIHGTMLEINDQSNIFLEVTR